ncbi:MAG: ribonuclease HIII [Erysipelotrichaceae bacterium]|nr:ribonuclease HIII [Erysipelotrichaceae bacterium]
MNVISLTLNEQQIQKLVQAYNEFLVTPNSPYIQYQLKVENCVITIYTSKKVVFQGKDAEIYASSFQVTSTQIYPQAGSDEVGTGDYFGPVCVCACIVQEKDKELLQQLRINDSKQIKDEDIRRIGKQLIQTLPYSLCILDNKKYNQIHDENNMNMIKAKLHNQCYIHLEKKCGKLPAFKVVDQFTPEKSYYQYVSDQPTVIGNIHFETKAESKYDAVACASIIARYAFLQAWDKMEKKYNMTFVKGASSKVDECIIEFVKLYGKDELQNVAKLHFQNTKKARI